ncbi:MAG: MBL fold metallo-hydrolase [Desulfobulbaceae bacterium DB1]|nr:MAG: MBL fold metallo-hydrolase [Desulfobulbaceae bacterium DB1]
MLIKQMTVGSMAVCCYLVACEETKKGMVIDPGGDHDKILAMIEREGVSLQYIVNTHGHPDHVCANGPVKKATGAAIVMHEDDARFFARPEVENYFSMLGLPPSPPPDKLVKNGDILEVGSLSFQVLHTPGHTPGGICLYSAPHLFSGDTLFVGAVGRTDFLGGDLKLFTRSIREKLLSLPDDTVVWPGHGYGGSRSTIGEEKHSNPYLNGEF